MPKQPILTPAIIEGLKREKMTQSEIARQFGVSRSYVSWIKGKYGGSRTPREVVLETWPWTVPVAMGQASPCRRLRDHAEFMATGGKGMSESTLKRLKSFYDRLRRDNVVIEFDPDLPPEKGVSTAGGWAYRTRLPSDKNLLIRVNEHTNLTSQGKVIWRFPPKDPEL